MSDIESLLSPIETKIERLEGDHGSKFAEPMDAQLAAWEQVRATLLLAHETKRIADILESITWTPDDDRNAYDDQQRALIVIQPHAEG